MNIWVVDDDAFVLKLIRRQLKSLEHTGVVLYQYAADALAALESATVPVDLILCDIQMPEMDGVELIRHLAQARYRGGLVLMSGEDERILHSVQLLAKAHGIDVLGAFTKPVTPADLDQVLLARQAVKAEEPTRPARKIYPAAEIARAIKNGELVNYYQPKVSVPEGELVGVETLVRWQHPRDGLVFPDQFIDVAEKNGLIDELTQVVLSSALRQSALWRTAGLALSVAVNVSMDNLKSLDFFDFVIQTAAENGVDLASLVLEITESQLMDNPLTVLETLTRLRLRRVILSIDDFGTGHSSLAQLRDIPFNELKVDAGFVHGASHNRSRRIILEASLDMAKRLDIKSVAEGVETRDDWIFLTESIRCDVAQGYFIARPMPAGNLAGWAQEWDACRNRMQRERYEWS